MRDYHCLQTCWPNTFVCTPDAPCPKCAPAAIADAARVDERAKVLRIIEKQAVAAHDRGQMLVWAAFNDLAELIERGPRKVGVGREYERKSEP